jgi:DNA-binding NtrC family response regulator
MTMKATILIIDDNPSTLSSLELYLKHKFDRIFTLKNPQQLLSLLEKEIIDVVLLDMNFSAGISSGNEGLYWMKRINEFDSTIPVILITAYGDVELAVKAMKEGASDFILKPWDNYKLFATIQAALRLRRSETTLAQLQKIRKQEKEDTAREFNMVQGTSDIMKPVYELIRKVAQTEANVLITGENGTGKELVAREIHNQSGRSEQVFSKVDLGSLSPTLFESEMFGHVKGAFTDAFETRAGRFENANGGTLFLDEIGNLTVPLQTKLLTVIESRKISPVGSLREINVDVRLISATNMNLISLVKEGLFREDLLYRINTIHIHVPPLRERGEDIIILAQKFLAELSKKYNKHGIKFNAEAIELIQRQTWPGNIRELKHAIERAVILCEKQVIRSKDLFMGSQLPILEKGGKLSLDDAEKRVIREALENHHYNVAETANELKITRQTLYRKINRYGLR